MGARLAEHERLHHRRGERARRDRRRPRLGRRHLGLARLPPRRHPVPPPRPVHDHPGPPRGPLARDAHALLTLATQVTRKELMHIGVLMFSTDYSMRIDDLAREAEARGFESLFVPEHTHIPTSRRSPFAGGGELPKEYWHTLDPFVGLMAAASVDEEPQGRHRHLPDHRARHDRHREGGGHPRLPLQRPLPLRHRRRLERGGDGEPRHRLQDALQEDGRAGARDEGDLDEGRAEVPRRVRQLRSALVVAEARAEAAARPCSSAARAATRSSAWSTTATAGSRAGARRTRSCPA